MIWLQDITIYHKVGTSYERYNIKASVRNTSIQNRNNTGVNTTDKALIRVFDTEGYKKTWKVSKNDVIVNKCVYDEIDKAPITELKKKYDVVYQVVSIDEYLFNDEDLPNHIKIGAI